MRILPNATRDVEILTPLKIAGDVSVGGTLSVTNFLPTKPWVGFLCTTTGGIASISYHVGFKTTGVSISHSAGGVYAITIPAHPNGVSYLTIVSPYTTATGAPMPIAWPTSYAFSSTIAYVYCRTGISTTFSDGCFFFYTVS